MIKDYMNDFDEIKDMSGPSVKKKAGLVVSAMFLVGLVFMAAGCTSGGGTGVSSNVPDTVANDVVNLPDTSADDIMVAPQKDDDVAVLPESEVPDKKGKDAAKTEVEEVDVIDTTSDKMVTLVVEESGRVNPFQPRHEVVVKDTGEEKFDFQSARLKYDLVDPPDSSSLSEDAEKVMTTKVSGIMYEADCPSALLNIENSDYLVRSGDLVNGYKVLAISPTIVTVQRGTNIYKAGVGEIVEKTEGIYHNTISDLDNKFGGSKNKTNEQEQI